MTIKNKNKYIILIASITLFTSSIAGLTADKTYSTNYEKFEIGNGGKYAMFDGTDVDLYNSSHMLENTVSDPLNGNSASSLSYNENVFVISAYNRDTQAYFANNGSQIWSTGEQRAKAIHISNKDSKYVYVKDGGNLYKKWLKNGSNIWSASTDTGRYDVIDFTQDKIVNTVGSGYDVYWSNNGTKIGRRTVDGGLDYGGGAYDNKTERMFLIKDTDPEGIVVTFKNGTVIEKVDTPTELGNTKQALAVLGDFLYAGAASGKMHKYWTHNMTLAETHSMSGSSDVLVETNSVVKGLLASDGNTKYFNLEDTSPVIDSVKYKNAGHGNSVDVIVNVTDTDMDRVNVTAYEDGVKIVDKAKASTGTVNDYILQDAFTMDEVETTYATDVVAIDKESQTTTDSVSYTTQNTEPVIDSTSYSPTDPVKGDSLELQVKYTDSENNVKGVNVTVKENGTNIIDNENMTYSSGDYIYQYVSLDKKNVFYNMTYTIYDTELATDSATDYVYVEEQSTSDSSDSTTSSTSDTSSGDTRSYTGDIMDGIDSLLWLGFILLLIYAVNEML